MDTQLLESNVLYVLLPPEPQLRPEAALLRQLLPQMGQTHMVLDLSQVEIITSPSIGSLLLLQKQLAQRQRRLILCGARLATMCIFQVAGLDTLVTFAKDRSEALAMLRNLPAGDQRQ
jgi:anti-anti-sigma factor